MNMNKMMATLAVGGMIAGLAACGGSQAQPETPEGGAAGAESGAQAACNGAKKEGGEHSCKAGSCNGKKEAPPADGAAPAPAPADAPK